MPGSDAIKTFQRARKPEEKEVRREAILEAAREMLDEGPTDALSLNELARRSGVSKPNLYRYFESREEVLLQVWIDEVRTLGTRLEARFAKLKPNDVDGVIAAVVKAFAAQPKLCELTSICASVLERNLSVDAIVRTKQTLAGLTLTIAGLLHARLPTLSLEQCAWLGGAAATWVAGIWAGAHPTDAVAKAFERPELKGMRPDFEPDFTRYLTVLVRGLLAG